jgi:hypothetical protein
MLEQSADRQQRDATPNPFAPGDRVVCIDASDHAWFLTFGGVFTVDSIEGNGRVSLIGMARAWEVERFRLHVPKRGA